MKVFVVATLLLAASCSASLHGVVSTQYHSQDTLGQYSYGYADPNSQKSETRLANGVTTGAYSYVDGHGLLQSVKYAADPHTGFHVVGTNIPTPAVHAVAAPVVAHGVPAISHVVSHAAPIVHAAPLSYAAHGYAGAPLIAAHGIHGVPQVPQDTPEVAAAKLAHFAAHAKALHHLHKRSASWGAPAYNQWAHAPAPVIHNGVPVETPEVQQAKAAHLAAHAAVQSSHPAGPSHYDHYNPGPAHYASGPVAYAPPPQIHNGVPVETPEVQQAKAAHYAAVAEAERHAAQNPGNQWDGHHSAPVHYAPAHNSGPYHIPVIQNGVPVETPEVQQAKAAHLAAISEAQRHSAPHGAWGAPNHW